MVLSPLALVLVVALPLALGAATLRALGLAFASDRIGYLGWAWVTGSLGLAVLEGVRLLFALPSPSSIVAGAAIACVALWLVRKRSAVPRVLPSWNRKGVGERLLAGALVLVLVVTLARILRGSLDVVIADDEANFWAARAKLLFQAGSFGGPYAEAMAARALPNGAYPILNPLLQLWVFDLAGTITHQINRLPIEICSFALYLCAASALRRWSPTWIAALLLVMLASCDHAAFVARKANSDVLVALGALVGLDALARWREEGQGAWLGLASLAGAFLVWSKKEGVVLAVALAAAWCVRNARDRAGLRRLLAPRRAHLWLVPPLAVLAVTLVHNTHFHATGSHSVDLHAGATFLSNALPNSLPTLGYFFGLALQPSFHAIPVAFVVLVLFLRRGTRSDIVDLVPLLVLITAAVLFPAFVKSAPEDLPWLLDTAGTRVLYQLVPLQLLWIATALNRLFEAREGAP
jgi:hypothetical protein